MHAEGDRAGNGRGDLCAEQQEQPAGEQGVARGEERPAEALALAPGAGALLLRRIVDTPSMRTLPLRA